MELKDTTGHTNDSDRNPREPALQAPAIARGLLATVSVYIYVGFLAVSALALAATLIALGEAHATLTEAPLMVILAGVGLLSRRFPVRLGRLDVDFTDVAVLCALTLAGPFWALAVAVPSFFYRPWLRTIYVASSDTTRILAAGLVFYWLSEPLLAGGVVASTFIYALFAAGVVFYSLDALHSAFMLKIKYGTSINSTIRNNIVPLLPADVLAILTVVATLAAVYSYGPIAAVVLFSGTAATLTAVHLIHQYRRRSDEADQQAAELQSTLQALGPRLGMWVIDSLGRKDGYTHRHASASATYARDLALWMEFSDQRARQVGEAAAMQNVGLITIPDELLSIKQAKLNPVGRQHWEEHPIASQRLLETLPGFEHAAIWVRYHHECEDGTGYPDRLRGQWIPLESKIIATTALYASLVLDTPDAPALSPLNARRHMLEHVGQLNDQVLRAFLALLDTTSHNYQHAADDNFVTPKALASRDVHTTTVRSL